MLSVPCNNAWQDYEAALSSYKLARDDFKSDKAWLHLGAVYEMMALCYHHLSDPHNQQQQQLAGQSPFGSPSPLGAGGDGRFRRDIEICIDEALKASGRKAKSSHRPTDPSHPSKSP